MLLQDSHDHNENRMANKGNGCFMRPTFIDAMMPLANCQFDQLFAK
jgi:hypothetical protein